MSAQNEAVRRYNATEKHKISEKNYEQGTGKTARERYLKSDKYKARRREYNQRLQESLRIARSAHLERAKSETVKEVRRTEEFADLLEDVRSYFDSRNKTPTTTNIIKWAKDSYGKEITEAQAKKIIDQATLRR
jgi:hypothetical protein